MNGWRKEINNDEDQHHRENHSSLNSVIGLGPRLTIFSFQTSTSHSEREKGGVLCLPLGDLEPAAISNSAVQLIVSQLFSIIQAYLQLA